MTNAATLLSTTAARHPGRIAVRHDTLELSYAALLDRVRRLAGALSAEGLRRGDRVALVQTNSAAMIEALFACMYAGFVVVPINARSAPPEIAYVVGDCGARALLHDASFNDGIAAVAADMASVAVQVSTAPSRGERDYEALVRGAEPLLGPVDVEPAEPAWLFYTSGTTGRPKGAIWTHRTIIDMAVWYLADVTPLSADDVVLHIAPLSHGSVNGLFSAVAKGATTAVLHGDGFQPHLAFDLIDRYHVTVISFAAPTQLVKMLDQFDPANWDLSSLRCIQYGGAPMYRDQLIAAIDTFGPILVQIYGQAEFPMTITSLGRDEHRDLHRCGHERLSSAGTPRTGIEVGIVDEGGALREPGAVGEVVVRGALATPGYWGNEAATAAARTGTWQRTGDVGRIDDAGYLFLMDRATDMIISGCNNVYPREVEDALLLHPAVVECAVFGIPHRYWGEAVHAVVTVHPGAHVTAQDLIRHVGTRLAGYKKPKSLDFVTELPRNAYGKVLRRDLREPFWADRAIRVGGS